MNSNRNFKKKLAVATALCVSASMAVTPVFAAGNLYKDESVYVNADASGKVETITVSDWIQNPNGDKTFKDLSDLKEIKNIKGNEKFTQKGDSVSWKANGKDIYYQGETKKQLPVTVKVIYELDGKEMNPKDMLGKSGHMKMTIQYTNHTSETVTIGGEKVKMHVPFMMLTTGFLPVDKFSNVAVNHGKIVSDSQRIFMAGASLPGLSESLDLPKDSELDIPEDLVIEADVKDFEMCPLLTVGSANAFNKMNLDKIDDLDELQENMDKLTDASLKLVEGSEKLSNGLKELDEKSGTLVDGVNKLAKGAGDLNAGASKLKDGGEVLNNGIVAAHDGAAKLDAGSKVLSDGTGALNGQVPTLVNGVNKLDDGAKSLNAGAAKLKDGTGEMKDNSGKLVKGAKKLNAGLQLLNKQVSGIELPENADDKIKTLVKGIEDYTNGVAAVQKGSEKLADGTKKLVTGSEELQTGVNKLSVGTGVLQSGVKNLGEGAAKLHTGAYDAYLGAQNLRGGINTVAGYSNQLKDGTGKLAKQFTPDSVEKKKAEIDALASAAGAVKNVVDPIKALAGQSQKLLEESVNVNNAINTAQTEAATQANANAKQAAINAINALDESVMNADQKAAAIANLNVQEVTVTVNAGINPATIQSTGSALKGVSGLEIPEMPSIDVEAKKAEIDKLAGAVNKINAGAGGVAGGVTQLQTGVDTLYQGLGKLNSGFNGDKGLLNGIGALSAGVNGNGTAENPGLVGGIGALSAGVNGTAENPGLVKGAKAINIGVNGDGTKENPGLYPALTVIAGKNGELTAGTKKLAGVMNDMLLKVPEMQKGVKELYDGSNLLVEKIGDEKTEKTLIYGISALNSGADALYDGSSRLAAGTGEMKDKSGKLVKGAKDLNDGAVKLHAGAAKLSGGTGQLEAGSKTLVGGLVTLCDGTVQLKNGTGTLKEGSGKLVDGVHKLNDGGRELAEGMKKFNDEGIKKISDFTEGDIEKVLERMKSLKDLSEDYTNYSGISGDMEGEVKFIIETAPIEEDK